MAIRAKRSQAALLAIGSIWAIAVPAAAADSCNVRSAAATAALVELYTSEGCSSCPPAEEQLSFLRRLIGAEAAGFGLALHVDYWDSLGWRDPYAQAIFSERHQRLVQANGHGTLYTPHFFVNGSELAPSPDAVREEVRSVNSRRAQAQIQLHAERASAHGLALDAAAQVVAGRGTAALNLVVAENGLVSHVLRGENQGRALTHDHVARIWIGPIALADGQVQVHRELSLPGDANTARWEVTAFVEDQRTGEVLQAVGMPPCARF